MPGIGPVIATALVAAVGDAKAFASGRHLAAWLGLVPRQPRAAARSGCSGSASGATATCAGSSCTARGRWWRSAEGGKAASGRGSTALLARRPFNVVVAAVANKLARIAWALLSRGEGYRAAAA